MRISRKNAIKSYKGFSKDMKCRGFQYEEGKEYETNEAKCCKSGFHACENPIDMLEYYEPCRSVYHEVKCWGDIDGNDDDSKFACTHIKIGKEVSVEQLCKDTFDYVKSKCTNEQNTNNGEPVTAGHGGAATAGYLGISAAGDGGTATAGYMGVSAAGNHGAATAGHSGVAVAKYSGVATAGNSGVATAGNYGIAKVGYCGVATVGDGGVSAAGDYGTATAGNYGAATTGNYGAATAGNCGVATAGCEGTSIAGHDGAAATRSCGIATVGDGGSAAAGYEGFAIAGVHGIATSRGRVKVGKNGIGCVRGENVKIMGGMGAILMIAIENDDNYNIKEWKAVVVDGTNIKADTWYTLKGEELVEAK